MAAARAASRRVSGRLACRASPPLLALPDIPLLGIASHLELETIAALVLAVGSKGPALLAAAAGVIEKELLRRNHAPLTTEQNETAYNFEFEEFGQHDSVEDLPRTPARRSHLQYDARARFLRADAVVLDEGAVDRESIYVHGEAFGAWAGITWENSVLLSLPDKRPETAGARILVLVSAAFENGEGKGPCLHYGDSGSYFHVIDVLLPGNDRFQTMIAFETVRWCDYNGNDPGCRVCDTSTARAFALACGVRDAHVGRLLRALAHCAFEDAWDYLQGNYLHMDDKREQRENYLQGNYDSDDSEDDSRSTSPTRPINDATLRFPNITDNFRQQWKENYEKEERYARASAQEVAAATIELGFNPLTRFDWDLGFNSITLDAGEAPRRRAMKLCEALRSRSSLASTVASLHGWCDLCTYEQTPSEFFCRSDSESESES